MAIGEKCERLRPRRWNKSRKTYTRQDCACERIRNQGRHEGLARHRRPERAALTSEYRIKSDRFEVDVRTLRKRTPAPARYLSKTDRSPARHGSRPVCRLFDLDALPGPTLTDLAVGRESIFKLSTMCRGRDRINAGCPRSTEKHSPIS
jgi:hypothetical protein